MNELKFTVNLNENKMRIDKFLSARLEETSRSYIQKLIENQNIKVNGKNVNKSFSVAENQTVTVNLPENKPLEVNPENIDLNIIYEDKDLIVLNKPQGMVVHPAPGNYTGTLVNALLYYCKNSLSSINGVYRPGIVHRIDKNTSGLLVVAKNNKAHQGLTAQIKNHSFTREYEAIITEDLHPLSGSITTQIGRHKTNRKKMAVLKIGGRTAITHYETIKSYGNYSHVKLKLETGRTHQIRVHMTYLGHPIIGDDVYGKSKNEEFSFLNGQCLHARTLGFVHPTSGKHILLKSNLPEYFLKVIKILENNSQE